MEELDLLKKDWKKQEQHQPQLSYNEIYKMIWKRSSSLVKRIFYISLIELGVGISIVALIFFIKPEALENDAAVTPQWMTWFSYASTLVIFYFIYKFFMNYKKISTTSSVKDLMQNIISTRKSVKYYVIYNLSVIAFTICVAIPSGIIDNAGGSEKIYRRSYTYQIFTTGSYDYFYSLCRSTFVLWFFITYFMHS